jgi:hypothetical protein
MNKGVFLSFRGPASLMFPLCDNTSHNDAAQIIREQVSCRNQIWMKSADRLGNDIIKFVGDVNRHEQTGRKRDTPWAEGSKTASKKYYGIQLCFDFFLSQLNQVLIT